MRYCNIPGRSKFEGCGGANSNDIKQSMVFFIYSCSLEQTVTVAFVSWRWLSCSVCIWNLRSRLPLLCQVVTILSCLYLKLTVTFFLLVVSGGDIPAPVCIWSWRSHLPLLCQLVTFLWFMYHKLTVHICPCCVRWWLSCAVCIWSKSPHPSGRNWKSWSPMRDQGKRTEGNDDIWNPLALTFYIINPLQQQKTEDRRNINQKITK